MRIGHTVNLEAILVAMMAGDDDDDDDGIDGIDYLGSNSGNSRCVGPESRGNGAHM